MPGDGEENGLTEFDQLRETVKGLTESVSGISNLISQQAQSHQTLQSSVQALTESLTNGFNNSQQQQPEAPPPDFTDMDQGGVAKYILDQVQSMVQDSNKTINERLDSMETNSVKSERTREINELIEAFPDAEEWLTEMRDIAQSNPNLSVRQMYKLARAENPDKATQLDEKYKPEGEGEDEGTPEVFSGLTPTSQAEVLPTTPDESKQVSTKDGLLAAWNEVMPDHMKREAEFNDPLI